MSYNLRLRLIALVAVSIAAVMVLSAGAAIAPSVPAHASAVTVSSSATDHASPASVSTAASAEAKILSGLKASNVPMKDVFLPNFGTKFSTQNGVVTPLYNASPAPSGLGYFGVRDVGGVNVGTVSYTSSIEGAATLNAVNPLLVSTSAPDEFTIQLNTVLTHVDVLGDAVYDYWIQNVPVYAASSGTLSFEDNIWNFSSPGAFVGETAIYSHTAPNVGNAEVYIGIGPSFHVPTPFEVIAYNNATVFNDRPTIFFNYSIVAPHFDLSGSYDSVEFNSSATPPTSPATPPTFQINGQEANPTGFLLNDAEIMLGGPGGGSTTNLLNIAGSMGLWLLPNGTSQYITVPAAYDFGTDTGETSAGIAEASTTGANPTAILSSGPAILYPLWGLVGAHQGAETFTLHVFPTNAFVFASQGSSFDSNFAAWAPLPVMGPDVFWLSPGTYSFEFLLSEYTPVFKTLALHASHDLAITLKHNAALGDYTPLWAEANSQLSAISSSGIGTLSDPYVLFNTQAVVNPLFGEVNDYAFQVFPGIQLIDTTAYVSIVQAPLFDLTYSAIEVDSGRLAVDGLPATNDLNFELYDASHVSIVGSADISGWFAYFGSFGEPASIYLWNSTYDLIAYNTFYVQGNGITTSGGGFNTFFGNVFIPTSNSGADPYSVLNYGVQFGLWEFESNDLIYNNAFLTPYTATLIPENFYTGAFEPFSDRFNVSVQPASSVHVVNGWDLSGSILDLTWQGGNYWANYGTLSDPYGILPYNDGGFIYSGGDFHPLLPFVLQQVRFHEAGLPSGTAWSVTLNGYTQVTTGAILTFWEPNGAYAFTVGATGFTAHPSSGTETVNGHWVYQWINFT